MFTINSPMVSKRSLKSGRVVRIKDGEFECAMNEAYNLDGKYYDGCRFWFKPVDMLHPYEVTEGMVPNDTWGGKPVREKYNREEARSR